MHPTAMFLLVAVATTTAIVPNSIHATQALNLRPPASSHYAEGACIPRERGALLAFKKGITGDPAGLLASWVESGEEEDCCRWRGVRCSNRTGHVVAIQLRNPAADNYVLDPRDTALTGQISPSLLSLNHLESLDLSMNSVSGPDGRLPEFLGLLKNLRYLNLSDMSFTGRVPPHLGNLSKLHTLDISRAGYLNSTDFSWLSNLPLRYLRVESVDLSGVVDWAHVVNMIPSLKVLRLARCSLRSANQSLPHLNLTSLEELSLSGNIFGHPISSCWFWNLTSLRHLDLMGTYLYGQIPDALGRLTSLQVLEFAQSDQGHIDIITANMTTLCNLEIIQYSDSNFNGNITELFERLPQCSSNKLKELDLSFNNFTGVLPNQIGRWANLRILDLSRNQISGHLPSDIGMLRKLVTLELRTNQFTGPLPAGIGMLSNLLTLDLPYNAFSGSLPSEIGMLGNLTLMDLSYNNLSGVITHEHLDGLASLTWIDLSRNSIKILVDPLWLAPFRLEYANFAPCHLGPLFPSWLQSQTGIKKLDISSASIFDTIPDWFSTTFSKAEELYISNNGIKGTLPTNLKNMTSLHKLFLDSNQLTGEMPQLPTNLYALDISRNYLSGPLPANLGAPQLQDLYLFSNNFSGHIPQSICELNVEILNLGSNHLEGEFPKCLFEQRMTNTLILSNNMLSGTIEPILKSYTGLEILDLAWNNFTGSIPTMIATCQGLTYLNLAGNRISGSLPHHLSNLIRMTTTPLDDYPNSKEVNVSVTTKGQERYYYRATIYYMVSIDLSSNHLAGRIPEEIVSLEGVANLNLSRNNLTGKIPETIGLMHSLESLDLSENKLNGGIPKSLSNLTYLSFMDLSHNNLTGRIPSGGQLDTLYTQNPLMYDGNIGLYGYPHQKNGTDNSEPRHRDQKGDVHNSTVLTFSFGFSIGYVVSLWVVFCVILFKRSWRLAYFQHFDKASDKVYVFLVVAWAKWTKKTAS